MFEKASRMKLRFDTPRGRLTVEDLWDLPLVGAELCLDDMACAYHKELKDGASESFVLPKAMKNEKLQLKFDIVKKIIEVRLEEQKEAEEKGRVRQKKYQIMSIIAEKEIESLKDSSLDELKELLDSL